MSEKMTDAQIIDALERCAQDNVGQCAKCKYAELCKVGEYTQIFKDSLALIKRQQAELDKKSEKLQDIFETFKELRIAHMDIFADALLEKAKATRNYHEIKSLVTTVLKTMKEVGK